MEQQNEQNELLNLRKFLIQKFLIILAVVTIVEFFILQLINWEILPLLQTIVFGSSRWSGNLSASQMFAFLILVLCDMLVAAVGGILPSAAQVVISGARQTLEELQQKITPGMKENLFGSLNNWQSVLIVTIIFVVIMMMLVPYALGALWYAGVATKKVCEIELHRDTLRQEYDRKRNQMLSDIAHDLRTPITTVAGYAKALSDHMVQDESKKQEYLDAIQVKSARMNELIQLLFEYVKLDSDGYKLCLKQVDIAELLRKNAALMYADVETAGMQFVIDIPDDVCMEEVDEIQFSRVVTNLITNAIRHNGQGTQILLELKKKENQVKIVIADTGEVIEPELAEHIFEPFTVGDESRNSKGGSGLGLSIAYKIMNMHGWRLSYSQQLPGYSKGFIIQNYFAESAK